MASTALYLWLGVISFSYSLSILQMYGIYRFKSLQSLVIVQKRYPRLVLIESIAVITLLVIIFPLWCNQAWNATDFGIPKSRKITDVIGILLFPAISFFISHIELTRLWLISYDLHYLDSSKQKQWKSQIDSSFAEKDWYLRNKTRYGNIKWVIKRVFIYYMFIVILIPIIYASIWYIGFFVEGLFYLIMITVTVRIWYKTRKCKLLKDNFLFYYEFRRTMIIWLVCTALFWLMVICWILGIQLIAFPLTIILPITAWSGPSLLSTIWISRKITSKRVWSKDLNAAMLEETVDGKNEKLYQVLKDEEKFELLIQWMYREFSSESILCFIELIQFKEYMVNAIGNKQEVEYKYINLLYETFPRSSIVHATSIVIIDTKDDKPPSAVPLELVHANSADIVDDGVDMEVFKKIARTLYNKYIRYNAELEVNISASLRNNFVKYDESNWDMEIEEFVNIFDLIIHDMEHFIKQSFVRCQQT